MYGSVCNCAKKKKIDGKNKINITEIYVLSPNNNAEKTTTFLQIMPTLVFALKYSNLVLKLVVSLLCNSDSM